MMKQNYYQDSKEKNTLWKKTIHLVIFTMMAMMIFTSMGCNSSDDFVLTHQGQFLDAPVRGLDYICGGEMGVTDDNGMFTFERGRDITIRLGNITIGETVPVVSGLDEGNLLPDIWIFTPRHLVPAAESNRDETVTNILRFLQTLDNDYDRYDGIDNAANGIHISDAIRHKASTMNLSLDFTLDGAQFERAAEEVIGTLTGEYRPLIPALSAQHHFMSQLVLKEIDSALNRFSTPGVTLSMESPCPCDTYDTECINSGTIDGLIRYDAHAHSYIWDFAGGYADIENKRPMTVNTRFRIHSLTKAFVAMTIFKLVEEGLMDHNDLLRDHLPEPILSTFNRVMDIPSPMGPDFPSYAEAVTVASVINHSSGINNFYTVPSPLFLDLLLYPDNRDHTANPYNPANWEKPYLGSRVPWDIYSLSQYGLESSPIYYPGMGWSYSNTGYTILGLVIEKVTGEPWEKVVRERIIEPFGLEDIFIPEPGEYLITGPYAWDPAVTDDYAYGYLNLWGMTEGLYGNESDDLVKRDIQAPEMLSSSGNMIGTAPSLRAWIKLVGNIGSENGLFGESFDLFKDENLYEEIFFTLNPFLNVGPNVYHNTVDQRYIISGNSTGYDVNATYDIKHGVAAGGCANRTYDKTAMQQYSGPDIWRYDNSSSLQIKDVLVFNALNILTR
ncbi:MAG: beta-lactamase family protein [Desulfamplus sp.]|nr:beta-lactamase family protein [Desulfamplus sp.]